MKLSIVIPVYNTGESACRLVRALLPQYADMEIILVDDGSRDDSLAQLRRVARGEKRVRVLHQENAGASAARNAGINISQGEYLAFIDSDDEVADDYIARMLGGLEKHKSAVMAACAVEYHRLATDEHDPVYTSPMRVQCNREKYADYVLYLFCRDGRIYGSVNKMYRASVIRENGLKFQEGRDFAEDTKFVLDYLAACRRSKKYSSGDIFFVLEPIYIYKFGTATSTVKKSSLKWENWERSYADLLEWAKEESGGKLGLRTRMLLRLVRVRWHISHRRALKRDRAAKEREAAGERGECAGKTTEKWGECSSGAANKPGECAGKSEHTGGKYIIVGLAVTLFDFLVCTLLTRLIFRTNDMIELAALISTALATVLAYFLHSRITWRDRKPTRRGVIMFFLWNALAALVIKPGSTWFFGLLTGLYQFAFSLTSGMGLPFDYETVEYLGIYALATVVLMTLNFIFYDKLVFGKRK